MKTYKVWVEIEECDEENDTYETLDCPGAAIAEFSSYDSAYNHASQLYNSLHIVNHADTIKSWATKLLRESADSEHLDTGELLEFVHFVCQP